MATMSDDAYSILAAQLKTLEAKNPYTVYPDQLGEGLEKIVDFQYLDTNGQDTIRLDVWRDIRTGSMAGVHYLHNDRLGCYDCDVVHVKRRVKEEWLPA